MKDFFNGIKGQFKLESRDEINNEWKIEVEDKNLVMNTASIVMATIVGGSSYNKTLSTGGNFVLNQVPVINTFKLGFGGHNTLNPTSTRTDWPNPAVTDLYNTKYVIRFEPNGTTPTGIPATVLDSVKYDNSTTVSEASNTVIITRENNVVSYEIFIKEPNCVTLDGGLSEAGLFVGNNIFAMKCFPFRQKDNTTEWKITWSITW